MGENYIVRWIGDLSDVQNDIKTLERINQQAAQKMGADFTKATRIISSGIDRVTQKTGQGGQVEQIRQLSTVYQDASGKVNTFTERIRETNEGSKTLSSTFKSGGTVTRTFSDDLKTLARRAALTIPVWFAIRQGVGGLFRTIREGLGDIASFDRALQKLRRNITATSNSIDGDFSRAKSAIQEFSIESGVAVQDITNAIQKFATVGFDIDTALRGGIQSSKLAVTLFGEAEGTANAFARSMRVLTNDMDSAEEKSQAIAQAIALTDQLWKTNAFNVDEFSGNLEKFAGTANAANLSISETLALLATLTTGGLSERAGRLLRTTLIKSLSDIEGISTKLDLAFDPSTGSTVQFLVEVVDKLKELGVTANQVPADLFEKISDIFNVRSAEPITALVALEKILKENLALLPDLQGFEKSYQNQTEQINRLVERYKNLNKEIGRSFATGITGAEDFADALKTVTSVQRTLNEQSEKLGGILRNTFLVGGAASVVLFKRQLIGLLAILSSKIFLGALAGFIVLNFKDEAERLAKEAKQAAQTFNNLGEDIANRINKGFSRKLSLEAINDLISDIEVFGAAQIGIEEGTLNRALETLKGIRDTQQEITEKKQEQQKIEKESNKRAKLRKELAEELLDIQLQQLKSQGATSRQILEAEIAYRKQHDLQGEAIDQAVRQVQLEKEKAEELRKQTEEQRLQSELGSESLKLFRIAQTQGVDVAKQIGDVLSGDVDFSSFIRRGGEVADIFKKEFGDIFEQQQALQFFSGDRVSGLQGLRGGAGITIEEDLTKGVSEAVKRGILNIDFAEKIFDNIKLESQSVNTLNVNKLNAPEPITSTVTPITPSYTPYGNRPANNLSAPVSGVNRNISSNVSVNINVSGQTDPKLVANEVATQVELEGSRLRRSIQGIAKTEIYNA